MPNAGRYDLSSVAVISSSGVMWSHENKQGLLRHMPQAILFDSFGSSEAVGLGASVSAAGAAEATARFAITENNAVFTDSGRRVEPGSGRDRHGRRRRVPPRRLLQGRRQDGGHVPRHRRPSLEHPRRLRHGQRRRHDPAPRPRLGVHQHRWREGLPRGGRGGAQDAPGRPRRRRRRRARRPLRRGDRRRRRSRRGRRPSTPTTCAPTSVAASRRTRRHAACSSSTRSAGRPTARSTTSGSRPRPSPSSLGDERRGPRPRRIEPYAGCCDRSARSTATASSS